jgi:hypothetical protein
MFMNYQGYMMNIKDLKKTNKIEIVHYKKEITEDQKEDNMLSNLGLSREDLDDSGDMLEELKEIVGFYDE